MIVTTINIANIKYLYLPKIAICLAKYVILLVIKSLIINTKETIKYITRGIPKILYFKEDIISNLYKLINDLVSPHPGHAICR